jgi:N-acetylmuramoyl-L-alanine amidase
MSKKYLVIHHTAGHKDDTAAEEKAMHLKEGYVDLAYNKFIEWDGKVIQGRPDKSNAANLGLNPDSISICLAGNFELYDPSPEQEKSLIQSAAIICKREGILPENIIGHYQVAGIAKNPKFATACPGKNAIKKIPEWRAKIKKYL